MRPAPPGAVNRTSRFRLRAHLRTLAMNCRPFMSPQCESAPVPVKDRCAHFCTQQTFRDDHLSRDRALGHVVSVAQASHARWMSSSTGSLATATSFSSRVPHPGHEVCRNSTSSLMKSQGSPISAPARPTGTAARRLGLRSKWRRRRRSGRARPRCWGPRIGVSATAPTFGTVEDGHAHVDTGNGLGDKPEPTTAILCRHRRSMGCSSYTPHR